MLDKLRSRIYSRPTWKYKLKYLLIAKVLWGLVDRTREEPTGQSIKPDSSQKKINIPTGINIRKTIAVVMNAAVQIT